MIPNTSIPFIFCEVILMALRYHRINLNLSMFQDWYYWEWAYLSAPWVLVHKCITQPVWWRPISVDSLGSNPAHPYLLIKIRHTDAWMWRIFIQILWKVQTDIFSSLPSHSTFPLANGPSNSLFLQKICKFYSNSTLRC